MRRDTPLDVPVAAPVERVGPRGLETLEALYESWAELKVAHAVARERHQEEREKLEHQGAFLVGTVRAAGGEATPAAGPVEDSSALVARRGALSDFLHDAEQKLAAARAELEQTIAAEEAEQARALEALRVEISGRVDRFLKGVRPRLKLWVRPVDTTRSILHLERVSADESVLLLHLLSGGIPSRYNFLFDDSTEDLALPPSPLFADEGVEPSGIRPSVQALRAYVHSAPRVLAVKGFLPVVIPRADGGEDFFRLLQRGPVMEAEVQEGDAFRGVLTRDEGERLAGHLLRMKLEGRLDLEIQVG